MAKTEIYTEYSKIANDSVFIMRKTQVGFFLHYEGKDGNGDAVYDFKREICGAAIWHEAQGQLFIAMMGQDKELEVISVKKVLKL